MRPSAATIHLSNRLEILAEHLGRLMRDHPLPPLEQETIVIPGRGMERWLSQTLARQGGVCAGVSFPFPASFVDSLLERLLPDLPPSTPFDMEHLTWRIDRILDDHSRADTVGEIGRYLQGEDREIRRFQLARESADIIDRCTIYRPTLLDRWEQGDDDHWLGGVWRRIVNDCGPWHRGRRGAELLRRIGRGEIDPSLLPRRVILFGISYLTPFHLEIILGLSPLVGTHLFVLSPCREYWGDDRRTRSPSPETEGDPPHPLLASFGSLGREFYNRILERNDPIVEVSDYRESGETTLLALLQNDILDRRCDRVTPIDPDDRSLSVQVCHSPMREVEVLYDQLLHLFLEDPTLSPRDVVVMTPDIDTYAPCIQAVFGTGETIPWTIADPSPLSPPPYGTFLSTLLALPDGRFTAPEIIDLLESTPVIARCGFTPDELDRIRRWVNDTGIVWGIDEHDREERNLPPYREGSWRGGIERLLWGYFMEPSEGRLYGEVSPFPGIEGESAGLLGRFVTLFNDLARICREISTPRTLTGWGEYLVSTLTPFAPPEGEQHDFPRVIRLLRSLEGIGRESGHDAPIPREVIRRWVAERIGPSGGGGLMTGRVTVCAMLPMRSIPARVVAIVGLNDGSFPRSDRPSSLDPLARNPLPGDRSVRDEDRYLFLEAILSARSHLLLTYTGMSVKDDSPIPPSVAVSELLDYLDRRFTVKETHPKSVIVTRHPLHPFDPRYFTGRGELFSHSERNLSAARALCGTRGSPPPFVTSPLSLPETISELSIDDLREFVRNPSRFFLKRRLGFTPRESSRGVVREETFTLDGLGQYLLRDRIFTLLQTGKDAGEIRAIVRAEGLLPPGGYGEECFESAHAEILPLLRKFRELTQGTPPPPPLPVDLTVGGVRVTGVLHPLLPGRVIRCRPSSLRVKEQLTLWVEHLLLHSLAPPDQGESTLLTPQESLSFTPLDPADALSHLEGIVTLVVRGMGTPLPLFPETSHCYAERSSIAEALKLWEGDRYNRHGEREDPSVLICFRGRDPFGNDFKELADTLFPPMIRSRSILK